MTERTGPAPTAPTAPAAAAEPRRRGGLGPAGWYPLAVLFGLNAVDELDRSAYGILLPEIRDHFGLSNSGILSVVAVAAGVALFLTVPIAHLADRSNRVRLALAGAVVWAAFSFGTGLAIAVWMFVVMRSGSAIGQAVIFPTHNSLLADYYPIAARPRVYAIHRAASSVGVIIGLLAGAGLAAAFDWRAPFLVFAGPTLLFVLLGSKLREPGRGHHEREAAQLGGDTDVEELPPSFAEAVRMVWTIRSLRRIFVALPFLAASIIGFTSLASLQYAETFGLSEVRRAWASVPVQIVELGGVWIGMRMTSRAFAIGPSRVFRVLAVAAAWCSLFALGFALAPSIGWAIAAHALIGAGLVIVGPGVMASLSLAIPARARAMGFSIGALWVLPGLLVLPTVGWIGDELGFRWGMALMTPILLLGGLLIASVGRVIDDDIEQVWIASATRAQMLKDRSEGRIPLLSLRNVQVAYGDVRVLFGIDLDVDEGEVIALLGTNGAGKSTLLRAISGVAIADRGAVVFDGQDITHAPPDEIAPRGIAMIPGGEAVFPTLTVAENLRAAGWMIRRDDPVRRERLARVLELFPVLERRLDDPAGDLSGGQQQMLALGMAFLSEPRLLMIDELSLGLAPVVVEQLLDIVRDLADRGTTVILVEQSVNVALTVAETAYFMEKGEIRFHGPTEELLERPDILRSVFFAGAADELAPPESAVSAESAGSAESVGSAEVAMPSGTGPSRSDPPAIEVADASVAFGGVRAVDRVDLSIARGEIVGLIGPNGAGKTTLLDLVSGFVPADTGRIALFGTPIERLPAHGRARIGLGRSFQDSRLFPSLTVEETLAVALERWLPARDPVNAALRLPPQIETDAFVTHRVDRLIELLGLEAFRTKFVSELSTGSRRIVDLGCVLAHEPTVLLLDEPSSGIAQREAEALGPMLRSIRDHLDATLVVIEHDMALIASISDRLVALDQGRIIGTGPPAEVLADPRVVASYLGEDPATVGRSGTASGTTASPDAAVDPSPDLASARPVDRRSP